MQLKLCIYFISKKLYFLFKNHKKYLQNEIIMIMILFYIQNTNAYVDKESNKYYFTQKKNFNFLQLFNI